MTCSSCRYEWCWICENKWETTMCVYDKCDPRPRVTENEANHLVELHRGDQFRQCPDCRTVTERAGCGTDIQCHCGTIWCWYCVHIVPQCSCRGDLWLDYGYEYNIQLIRLLTQYNNPNRNIERFYTDELFRERVIEMLRRYR